MKKVLNFGICAIWINISGILLSGILFPVLTAIFQPQPVWQNPELFIQSFHWLQTATFFAGFILAGSSLLIFISLYFLTKKEKRIVAFSGLALNMIFTGVVFLNYIIQTTFIPYLAVNNPPEAEHLLAAFTMANPGSLAWAFEMYGWGGIGLSYLFMAFIFESGRTQGLLRILFLVNGLTSFGSALLTSIDMNWIFSTAGFSALIIWNLLILIIDFFLLKYFSELLTSAKINKS